MTSYQELQKFLHEKQTKVKKSISNLTHLKPHHKALNKFITFYSLCRACMRMNSRVHNPNLLKQDSSLLKIWMTITRTNQWGDPYRITISEIDSNLQICHPSMRTRKEQLQMEGPNQLNHLSYLPKEVISNRAEHLSITTNRVRIMHIVSFKIIVHQVISAKSIIKLRRMIMAHKIIQILGSCKEKWRKSNSFTIKRAKIIKNRVKSKLREFQSSQMIKLILTTTTQAITTISMSTTTGTKHFPELLLQRVSSWDSLLILLMAWGQKNS